MKKLKERNMEDHNIEGNSAPTYTKAEILERMIGCTSPAELRGYWAVVVEEKYRYSLNDLEGIKALYESRQFEFYINFMLNQL